MKKQVIIIAVILLTIMVILAGFMFYRYGIREGKEKAQLHYSPA